MIKELPLYDALITDNDCGMYALSLVDEPAVKSMVLKFEEDKKVLSFKVENEEKRIITGLIMAANRPIYRVQGDYEYYIRFSRETLEIMAEKLLFDGLQNSFNFQHNHEDEISGMLCREIYFKDVERGINPQGFEDVEDGSLFGTFFVGDDAVWEKIKEGTYGFSLEGIFDSVQVEMEQNPILLEENPVSVEDEIIEMLNKIIEKKKNRK